MARRNSQRWRVTINRAGGVLSLLVLAGILVATLTPMPGAATLDFWCLWCGLYAAVDIAANLVMFVPLGFTLALATNRRWLSALICVATTVTIELLQIHVVSGRDASLSDILANSVGGVLGVELALARFVLFRPGARAATRLVVAWSVAFVLICGLTSAGLRPAHVPRSLWVQWTPERRGFEPFTGKLLAFAIDTVDLPLGYPSPSFGLDRILSGTDWTATAKVSTEGMVPRRSIIARVSEEFTILVSVEQRGSGLECWHKVRASDFRFRSPAVVLSEVFVIANAVTPAIVLLTCRRAGGTLVAAAGGREAMVRLSPSVGWVLVTPFDVALTTTYEWVGALWLAALAFPLGYWGEMRAGARVGRRGRGLTSVAAVATLTLGLVVMPAIAGTAIAAGWEWAAALTGVVAGAGAAHIVRIVGAVTRRA